MRTAKIVCENLSSFLLNSFPSSRKSYATCMIAMHIFVRQYPSVFKTVVSMKASLHKALERSAFFDGDASLLKNPKSAYRINIRDAFPLRLSLFHVIHVTSALPWMSFATTESYARLVNMHNSSMFRHSCSLQWWMNCKQFCLDNYGFHVNHLDINDNILSYRPRSSSSVPF